MWSNLNWKYWRTSPHLNCFVFTDWTCLCVEHVIHTCSVKSKHFRYVVHSNVNISHIWPYLRENSSKTTNLLKFTEKKLGKLSKNSSAVKVSLFFCPSCRFSVSKRRGRFGPAWVMILQDSSKSTNLVKFIHSEWWRNLGIPRSANDLILMWRWLKWCYCTEEVLKQTSIPRMLRSVVCKKQTDHPVNLEEVQVSYTRWSGGTGYIRRGKCIRDEMFVSGRGECVCVKL